MNRQELKHILSSRFDFEQWKGLLGQMFPKVDYLTKPIEVDASLVKGGGQIGTIRLSDDRALGTAPRDRTAKGVLQTSKPWQIVLLFQKDCTPFFAIRNRLFSTL